jgi:Iap family predicted aminopeptidase
VHRAATGAAAAVLAALALAACGGGDSGPSGAAANGAADADRFDAERAMRDLRAQVRFGPRPAGSAANRRTTRYLARRLRDAGVEGVRIQRPHRNVVGVIPGGEPGAVVVGAHHDTKDDIPRFVGANDGASGVAVVLELARALPDEVEGPSIHVALFDAEETRGDRPFTEDGTRGSRQYVRYARDEGKQGAAPLDEVEAMVLFDLVGDCDLQIPREGNSDPGLYEAFADAAAERSPTGSPAPFTGEAGGILDDHIPFRDAGIPAVDLIDFTYGPGPSPGEWWHSPKDTHKRVCAESLDAVGEAALRALPRIPVPRSDTAGTL